MTVCPVSSLKNIEPRRLDVLFPKEGPLSYGYYREISRGRLQDYAREILVRAAAVPGAACHAIDGDPALGVCVYQHLDWDTRTLGIPSGRIAALHPQANPDGDRTAVVDAATALAEAALASARARGDVHISARVDAREILVIQGLEAAGFQVVDGILRFSRDLAAHPVNAPLPDGVGVRPAREADVPALRSLAAEGFVYDRFHNDPRIPSAAADHLHAEWVENAVAGRVGSGVLVAEVDGEVAGFFILAEDDLARESLELRVGTLVLITVGRRFRRRGVARALSLASAGFLGERGNRYAEVGTQIANVPASAVYLAAGFTLVQTGLSLRCWLGNGAADPDQGGMS